MFHSVDGTSWLPNPHLTGIQTEVQRDEGKVEEMVETRFEPWTWQNFSLPTYFHSLGKLLEQVPWHNFRFR